MGIKGGSKQYDLIPRNWRACDIECVSEGCESV
jgi:hypothetical protein